MVRVGNASWLIRLFIPPFRKQIALADRVTVTIPRMIRYFMTISEAAPFGYPGRVLWQAAEKFLFFRYGKAY